MISPFHIHILNFRPFFTKLIKQKYFRIWTIGILVLIILFWNSLPTPLFNDPYSTVVFDRHGDLLSAVTAEDEQWRFPPIQVLPPKFIKSIVCFEDKRFFYHPGVDPVAILRALHQNMKAGEIKSGGSTLTMQVIRMSRKNRLRVIREKIIETYLAFRLTLSRGKGSLLKLYASHAPFGGNVVGLEAASWRYFGRSPDQLSWAETATLTVLPNNPALIHPGKNRDQLKQNGICCSIEC